MIFVESLPDAGDGLVRGFLGSGVEPAVSGGKPVFRLPERPGGLDPQHSSDGRGYGASPCSTG